MRADGSRQRLRAAHAHARPTHLLVRGLPHVEDLPSERENAVAVPPDDPESRDGQRLGRVALGEDQRAFGGVFPTWQAERATSAPSDSFLPQTVELGSHMKAGRFFDDTTESFLRRKM